MPTSSTLAPDLTAACVMAVKFSSVFATGKPRKASFAPSSIMTCVGRCRSISGARRDRPPDVVSPLILALITVKSGVIFATFSVIAGVFIALGTILFIAELEAFDVDLAFLRDFSFQLTDSAKRFSNNATQPVPRFKPYSALSESPTTNILTGCDFAAVACVLGLLNAGVATMYIESKTSAHREKINCMNKSDKDSIIAVEHVFKSVTDSTGTLDILRDIDFRLAPKETCAIVGASGSGKSTLLSIIAGLDTPSKGTVRLRGQDIFAVDEDARALLRAQSVGFVFQSFQLMGNYNALENVMLPLELAGRKDTRKSATDMLGRVALSSRLNAYPKTLSGGEQQRVALARAFVVQPSVLLADEPTGSLDHATGDSIMKLMFELNAELGTTLVMVTHDPAIAARCERIITIEAGEIASA
jgi:putative ABC transport system ATP-binding protein